MEPLDFLLARKTVKHYVCSNCWGELEMAPIQGDKFEVTCKKCGDETKGYVTQYYVNRRRGESEHEEVNVRHLLQKLDIIPNPHKGKSTEQLLKELGF
jgi:DNA-directed RNA polymerase subunit RPC12/RpoP